MGLVGRFYTWLIASSWRLWGLSALFMSGLGLCLSLEYVALPERLLETHSPMLLYNDGSVAHIQLAPDDRWRTKVDLNSIDPAYIEALLSIEDERFYWHTGFDPISIMRALIQNTLSGEVVSGASTLTMQLVRIVEPRPRTYQSKLIEAWRAMQLEWHFSKKDILERYLSYIPFGKNIEGIDAASLAFFGHLPQHLEAHQIALLIAIPQNPNARYPTPDNHERLHNRRNHIANLLFENGTLPIQDDTELQQHVLHKPVPTSFIPFPRDLPHLMDQIGHTLSPSEKRLTTLDRYVQHTIQQQLTLKHNTYANQGIHNTSIVVVDKHTGAIRGLVGNFDYWEGKHGSTIPAYSQPRSAGSTLKPFIYAMSIDTGLATPARIMEDIPQNFRGYQPRNYGANYHGLVTLRESLSQSYNIPFIKLLSEMGLNEFLHLLSGLGIRKFEKRRELLGLSAGVGLELTPLELTQAYTTLANQGISTPLSLFENHIPAELLDTSNLQTQPISDGAAWLAGEALRQRDRPDFSERMNYTTTQKPFSWKTGTSFGFHDAWTAGWGADFVTTVWFGNLDQTSSVHLIGSEAAGTFFFELMERLESPFTPPPKPDSLTPVSVCTETGHLPSKSCPHTVETLALRTRVPTTTCRQHSTILVNQEGKRSTTQCTNDPLIKQTVWVPSIEYQRWSKVPIQLPPLANECSATATLQSDLTIEHPQENHRILLLEDGKKQDIPLEANHNDPHATLYWFIDQSFIGRSDNQETLWWKPTPGSHTIAVEDTHGNSATITVQVDLFTQ